MVKDNKLILTILIFPIIALIIWIASIQIKFFNVKTVMISVTGYDPRDLLSGHYVVLRPLWGDTNCTQFEENICPKHEFKYSYRFYLPEQDAKYLDRRISRSSDLPMELKFAMPINSAPIVVELYIENLTWKDWLKANPPKDY